MDKLELLETRFKGVMEQADNALVVANEVLETMNGIIEKIDKVMYVYNLRQASFLMKHNCTAVDCGFGYSGQKVYILFKRDSDFNVAMNLWIEECKKI